MAKDYRGARFGKLVMIARIGSGGPGRGALWACVCDCGNGCEKIGKDVAAGRIKSCGKCKERLGIPDTDRRINRETAALRKRYATAVRRAIREKIKWDLTPKLYSEIVNKPCSMCGTGPNRHTTVVTFNPVQGYTLEESGSQCITCRRLQGGNNILLFLKHMIKIVTKMGLLK